VNGSRYKTRAASAQGKSGGGNLHNKEWARVWEHRGGLDRVWGWSEEEVFLLIL